MASRSIFSLFFKFGGVLILLFGFLIFFLILLTFSGSLGEKCVAVINIEDELTTYSEEPSLFFSGIVGSEDIAREIENLNKRDDVAAVVFVINSPGGSVVASREIHRAISNLKKPKVAYFREVAASGGYYIATATDYIISEPYALTGSIGVIFTVIEMSELFKKVGINITEITSGDAKAIGFSKPLTEKERMILKSLIDEVFEDFKSAINEGRRGKLNYAKFNEVLDGRILTGKQAKEIGLVDELGSKRDAIKKAASLANLPSDDVKICNIDIVPGGKKSSFFEVKSFFYEVFDKIKKSSFQISYN